jgi:hypothetical protein
VFTWTGCLWTSSAIFGVSMLGAGVLVVSLDVWEVIQHLIS